MKDIKEYLPYYLEKYFDFEGHEWQISSVGKTYVTGIRYSATGGWQSVNILHSECKPHLRLLSDVSDEEWNEIEGETSLMPDAHGMDAVRDNFMIGTDEYRLGWEIVNEALIILRKRGIDVDGLIDAGLALDAKTTTP